jgi:hypothetical protein
MKVYPLERFGGNDFKLQMIFSVDDTNGNRINSVPTNEIGRQILQIFPGKYLTRPDLEPFMIIFPYFY